LQSGLALAAVHGGFNHYLLLELLEQRGGFSRANALMGLGL